MRGSLGCALAVFTLLDRPARADAIAEAGDIVQIVIPALDHRVSNAGLRTRLEQHRALITIGHLW